MLDYHRIREHLLRLRDLLPKDNQTHMIDAIDQAIQGSNRELEAFLVSNELWGGAGSIADEACIPGERAQRRRVEELLAELGELQIHEAHTNVRTASWVGAFRMWQHKGI